MTFSVEKLVIRFTSFERLLNRVLVDRTVRVISELIKSLSLLSSDDAPDASDQHAID